MNVSIHSDITLLCFISSFVYNSIAIDCQLTLSKFKQALLAVLLVSHLDGDRLKMTSVTKLQNGTSTGHYNIPTVSDTCLNPTYEFIDWLKWSQVASACIVGLFFMLQRRKRLCLGCTSGLPGIIYPVNLVDAYSDRFTFASAFCSTLKCVLDLFLGVNYIEIDVTDVPDVLKGTVNVITLAINVLLVCIAFYPVFLCLTTQFRVFGNAIGLVYSAYWTFYYVHGLVDCHQTVKVYGVMNLFLNAPVIVCYLILIVRFTWGLCAAAIGSYTRMKKRQREWVQSQDLAQTSSTKKQKHRPECTLESQEKLAYLEDIHRSFTETHYYVYVKHLLATKNRMCGVFTSGMFQTILTLINQNLYYSLEEIFHVSHDSFVITSYIALAITVFFIVSAVLSYRQHTLRMYKGDYSFCPNEPFPNWTVIVSGFRYTGYHIAYTIWGCIIIHLGWWTVVLFSLYFIIYPFRDGHDTFITSLIRDYGLTLFGTYAFYYSQALGAFLFFLQNRGNGVLGLDNRRYFHNATYVLIFYNVVIGLASCLMRIVKALLFGTFYIGRLDRCLLMRGWELWDTGYRAYLGFLRLEIVHSHPVLITFCHFLYTSTVKKRANVEAKSKEVKLQYFTSDRTLLSSEIVQRRRKVARNRWFVAITLIRNSQLVCYRSPERIDLEKIISVADDTDKAVCIENQQSVYN
ncbi:stimulated by retinoic acid gene 6 protein-like [Anneissia japonica]|uniref:stimulated by retinoic acid gene 6 protein-like n=1 Tax=Anneissia japonica TaxID=1529436 RepID=UPI001425BA4E|nr:stimulated by retinoic acid gene 6 protein-like [Anneissia japonica]